MSKAIPLAYNSPEYKAISALNIIYEAGLDEDSRPILVLLADNLPNPDIYDYDLILSFILARLDEFVESDYVLVFFSSPAKFRPGWFWLLKAYRSLDRRYKKNLKALYVVHLIRFYRIIFDFANRIVSPKFARKLHYCSNLEDLRSFIKLDTQFIPQRVIDYDNQLPIVDYTPTQREVRTAPSLAFGRDLFSLASEENATDNNNFIPKFVQQIVDHLREHALNKEGIFRKSPSSDDLHFVKNVFNNGEEVNLNEYDIDVSASLLKVFIRELPEPLIDVDFSAKIGTFPDANSCPENVILELKSKLESQYHSKPMQLNLLKYICGFLKEVSAHSNQNRMDVHNLAIIFTPNIVRKDEQINLKKKKKAASDPMEDAAAYLIQMKQGMSLVQLLIARHEDIF